MKIATKIKASTAFIWIGALLAVLSQHVGQWLLWTGIAIVVIAGIYRYTMIRCPHCGQPVLDVKTNPGKCPHCGESVE